MIASKIQVSKLYQGGAVGLVLVIYLSGWATLPQTVFWSADEGAKYIQLHTLLGWQGGTTYELPYPGQRLDPAYHFYPQHPIFPQPQPNGQIKFHWPIWFPLISILPFKLFGLTGLYVIPLLSGVLVAWLSGRLTGHFVPTLAPVATLLVGLGSPIFFYSLLFWEHTLAVLLGLAALEMALGLEGDASGLRRGLRLGGSVALLLAATALRLEMAAYALALLLGLGIAMIWPPQGVSQILGDLCSAPGGLTNPPASGVDLSIHAEHFLKFGTDPPPHSPLPSPGKSKQKWRWGLALTLSGGLLLTTPFWFERVIELGWLGPRLQPILATGRHFAASRDFWRQLPTHLQAVWVNATATAGPELSTSLVGVGFVAVMLGGLAALVPWRGRGWVVGASGLLIGVVSLYALLLSARYRTIHSFFLPAPHLVLFFLLIPYARQSRHFAVTALTATTLLYFIFGTLAVALRQAEILANLEWGTRYLLMLYPLATSATLVGGWQLYQTLASQRSKYALLGLSGLLMGVSLGYQIRGVREVYLTKTELRPYVQALEVVQPQPLVTDLIWLPAVLAPSFVRQEIYILPQTAALYDWLEQTEGQVDTFVFAGFFLLSPDFIEKAPTPLTAQGSELVNGITFTQYHR